MTLHIVLTGGIASGKTAVSRFFEELGVKVIDADIIAREVVEPGSSGLKQISEHFGDTVLLDNGALNRQALRKIVFNDDAKREWLNGLLHPMIRNRMTELRTEAEKCDELYTVSVIPLYFETIHGTAEAQNYHRVLVVDSSEETQLERLMKRDGDNLQLAQSLMSSQAKRQKRLSIADDIINNNSDLHSLKQQVISLDSHYRDLARNGRNEQGG
ncbi:dephospho-CoA kinase [Kangiella japonica]|uniref:Dephospho-CoA kinase n=1 Tax=Kangiella japonica TaxID=647384 RepID=A0ABN0SU55_9GAMM